MRRALEIAAIALVLTAVVGLAGLSVAWWSSGLGAEQAGVACRAVYPEIRVEDCVADPRLRENAAERYGR